MAFFGLNESEQKNITENSISNSVRNSSSNISRNTIVSSQDTSSSVEFIDPANGLSQRTETSAKFAESTRPISCVTWILPSKYPHVRRRRKKEKVPAQKYVSFIFRGIIPRDSCPRSR